MRRVALVVVMALALCGALPAPAHASFWEEVKQMPINLVAVFTFGVKFTDTAMHWTWDNIHNRFVHPMALALADGVEAATFQIVDLTPEPEPEPEPDAGN